MDIARGAGTEIIRCHQYEHVGSTTMKLIVGVQHHIYTVLNATFHCVSRSGTEKGYFTLYGYDSKAGDTNQRHILAVIDIAVNETFVWNDKFSFNGYEPTNFTGPMDDATKQDAIADQGTVSQNLRIDTDTDSCLYVDE